MRAFCSTSRIAVPAACTSRITRKISAATIGASPREGSSGSGSLGGGGGGRAAAHARVSPPPRGLPPRPLPPGIGARDPVGDVHREPQVVLHDDDGDPPLLLDV